MAYRNINLKSNGVEARYVCLVHFSHSKIDFSDVTWFPVIVNTIPLFYYVSRSKYIFAITVIFIILDLLKL